MHLKTPSRALKHLRHSYSTRALEYSESTQGTRELGGHLGTRALRHIEHWGTWALKALRQSDTQALGHLERLGTWALGHSDSKSTRALEALYLADIDISPWKIPII